MKECLIEKFISKQKFASYLNIEQYSDNLIFSKKAYIPLSIIEISLRNALDQFLSNKISDCWYDSDFLTKDSIEKVNQAKFLLKKRREPVIKEKIIAELSFGFWVNVFKKPYEKKLRISDLKVIFPNLPNKKEKLINRDVLFKELNHIRNFRNRIFHYERVLNKNNYINILTEIYGVINYFDSELNEYTQTINNVGERFE